jgi:hypothetical protein
MLTVGSVRISDSFLRLISLLRRKDFRQSAAFFSTILSKAIFVEQSSTIECYCHPPKKKLEMIASKQACFIKQTNTLK